MTNLEYYKLSVLFDQKQFRLDQIQNLMEWVDHHDDNSDKWSTPAGLIAALEQFYPDREPDRDSGFK
jgi:hypothetical protein